MSTRPQAICRRIPGNSPMPHGNYPLERVGYEEREYYIEGTAQAYRLAGERTSDGKWSAEAAEEMPYVSRIVVRAPVDPARFSGTVLVEWDNVSSGVDVGPDWMFFHRHIVARGHVWVGVSAQKAGIDGGGLVESFHLKVIDADRYGTLQHPGDAWSYDIFTQAAEAVRAKDPESPLEGLVAEHVLAIGESQSAAFLVTYVNAIDPVVQLFDGYFVHGRPGAGASIEGAFAPRATAAQIEAAGNDLAETARIHLQGRDQIREDARVPVLVLQSETDVILLGGGGPAQPDGAHVRLWEIPGAAHADTYMLMAAFDDDGSVVPERMAELLQPTTKLIMGETDTPINSGPQQRFIGQCALHHLVAWVREDNPPPMAPRLEVNDGLDGFHLDDHGNVKGGIRNPWVDVPTAVLSGLGQTGETFAMLFGRTVPFDPATLAGLYPGGVDDFLAKFETSLDATIGSGFILPDERAEILALAAASYPTP